ncbi:MAG: hypothetical protein A2Y38_16740 [Spirochaetes bacterium GWB1_59_5]|nr:MAG: hypothetical protein A2Y38_16740 [Spirochaetes bacterium GWB1_59_5]
MSLIPTAAGHAELFAPASYVTAGRQTRGLVVNGCGPEGWKGALVPETMYGLDVAPACNIHDWMYVAGQTLADKEEADRVFLNNLLRLIVAADGPAWLRWLRRRRARTYYEAVSHFGGPAFWSGKNPDTQLITAAAAAI